ncbi:putative ribose-5-phosphate isomerase A domain protein [Photobacterium leiognathi lrivu.4.1]|uniref:Putative ribose-5-phosphate isomerase A domain protein n=1 Tax=Photobacterium leiognathi lrivu.4.1 TaxID=1248232 RepID=V5H1H8_PHOLE|nr:DUF2913 family protein [Photobacterium leiognathi]GAD28580.1 putative ribose-5-phosphate isomerase A domain protein [Photobacterium leiognathi lrivu.4.1]
MSKQHYHQQLSTLIDNALLHLYSQVAISHRFVPTAKRNTLLCQFLKPNSSGLYIITSDKVTDPEVSQCYLMVVNRHDKGELYFELEDKGC